jgi:hypothetical protein
MISDSKNKKFGSDSSLYPDKNDNISLELARLKYFRLEYPRGGHYNDGYSLVADFSHSYDDDLITLLHELGVTINLSEVKLPEPNKYSDPIYDEIKVNGVSKWLKRVGFCKINGDFFYISYGREGLIITANGGSYEVELCDVMNAIKLEKNLRSEFFDLRVILK